MNAPTIHLAVLAMALALPAAAAGPRPPQPCSPTAYDVLGESLGVKYFKLQGPDEDHPDMGIVMAAACRRHPVTPSLTIAAMAYQPSGIGEPMPLVIAVIDEAARTVVSRYRTAIEEDAATRVASDSLRIDTPPYTLSPTVRAFGVDFTSGYVPHCYEGNLGKLRTLYVEDGANLRPVLKDLAMTQWRLHPEGRMTCDNQPSVAEDYALSLQMGNAAHAGFRDIVVTATRKRDDRTLPRTAPFRHVLRYDGTAYPTKALVERYGAWRDAVFRD